MLPDLRDAGKGKRERRTTREQPPAIAHPILCASQVMVPFSQKLDWSTTAWLSVGQVGMITIGYKEFKASRGEGSRNKGSSAAVELEVLELDLRICS